MHNVGRGDLLMGLENSDDPMNCEGGNEEEDSGYSILVLEMEVTTLPVNWLRTQIS